MRTIPLDGKEYPIRLSVNAIEQIQLRYGNVEEMFDKIQTISEAKWVMWLMISEGIAYQNYREGSANTPPTEREIGMIMTGGDLASKKHTDAIIGAFNDCMGNEKNVTAGELVQLFQVEQHKRSTSPASN